MIMDGENGFSGLSLKRKYYSPRDNIPRDFLVPILKQAERYDRISAYFTSNSLQSISVGICSLVERGKKIRLITSPRLSKEDLIAIKNGYDLREKVNESLINNFNFVDVGQAKQRLELLSNLISNGNLEIKIAVMKILPEDPTAIFHSKVALVFDKYGNGISFSGSLNDTANGYGGNWEQIEVDTSEKDPELIEEDSKIFERLWANDDEYAEVFDLPAVVKRMLLAYHSEQPNYDLDQIFIQDLKESKKENVSRFFKYPFKEKRDYQCKAVDSWEKNNFRGLFNMATGTGKTITALMGLERLYNVVVDGIYAIVVCPQRHLVDQWADNIAEFGVQSLIGYSGSPQSDWKKIFQQSINVFNITKRNTCFVTTIATFCSSAVQSAIDGIRGKIALVVDEVHNIGSESRLKKLNPKIDYRLGLSATIDRYHDEEGTEGIRNYFGPECIAYSLKEAIQSGMLTHYNYHPIPCVLSDSEYSKFYDINSQIDAILNSGLADSTKQARVRPLKINGAMLIARIHSKYEALEKIAAELVHESHILVYCGKSKWKDDEMDSSTQEYQLRLVNKTVQCLGHNGAGFDVSKFTCEETPEERRKIRKAFAAGEIQVLVAIACLDEGVDIPSIRTAILTASGDNPKEYVQRRGRILRMYEGKDHAELYDLVAIPRSLEGDNSSSIGSELEKKFLTKEMSRMAEFASLSSNESETVQLTKKVAESYSMTVKQMFKQYSEQNEDENDD